MHGALEGRREAVRLRCYQATARRSSLLIGTCSRCAAHLPRRHVALLQRLAAIRPPAGCSMNGASSCLLRCCSFAWLYRRALEDLGHRQPPPRCVRRTARADHQRMQHRCHSVAPANETILLAPSCVHRSPSGVRHSTAPVFCLYWCRRGRA
jgi:hypothetical protein